MSDYKRAAERIWKFFESHAFTMNQADLAAILREEFPEQPTLERLAEMQGVSPCIDIASLAIPDLAREEYPERGDGSAEHPFTQVFSGKLFERKDYEGRPFSVGICERDDGYEITVVPVRSGPTRHYRIAPDGIMRDLAPAPDARANLLSGRKLGQLLELIDKLCRLGNGERDGNSTGNIIAQEARTLLLAADPAPDVAALREAAQGLLDLMDDVPIDPILGDETDRVFSRAEFEPLRCALRRGQA